MLLNASRIAELIPHAGDMLLLQGILEWSETRICCLGRDHREVSNPLRVGGRLHATSAIEYAAQAMAAHGALTGRTRGRPRAGYLLSLRDVTCAKIFLDDLEGDLVVEAERLLGEATGVIYRFSVRVGTEAAVSGRAMVMLDGDAPGGG